MVVLDVCAALQMAAGTKEGLALQALMLEGEEVIVPAHFNIELINALYKMARENMITEQVAKNYYSAINDIIARHIGIDGFETEVMGQACALKHPAYDIFYFVLARRNDATLLTVDKKLQALCLENHVNCILLVDL